LLWFVVHTIKSGERQTGLCDAVGLLSGAGGVWLMDGFGQKPLRVWCRKV
jgi:hypothetical protein